MSNKSLQFLITVNCFFLLVSQNVGEEFTASRWRRASNEYEVDTLVVVDDQFRKNWIFTNGGDNGNTLSQMQEYVSFLIREANVRLQNLRDRLPYSLVLNIVEFRMDEGILRTKQPGINGQLNIRGALTTFQVWLAEKRLSGYDHSLLISGYKFTDETNKEVAGRAYVAAMCSSSGTSVSIIHDQGGLQGARTLAHEIGHSLGAHHDGDNGNSCRKADRYVMASDDRSPHTAANEVNPWYFSTCSTQDINIFVQTLILGPQGSNCLENKQSPAPSFAATASVLPGQHYDLNAQCKLLQGPNSRACVGGTFGELSEICTSLYCLITARGTLGSCSQYVAAEGTTCGNKKWCRSGKCVSSSDAPELQEKPCPHGDSVVLINKQYSCSQWVERMPSHCYDETFEKQCCRSCELARKTSTACPWGDQQKGCTPEFCNKINSDGTNLAQICCDTCGYNNAKECSDATLIDGVTCEVRVRQRATQHCYNSTVAYHCCDTCRHIRSSTSAAGCEYGDLFLNCMSASVSNTNSCDKEHCCKTCASKAQSCIRNVFSIVLPIYYPIIYLLSFNWT